jgi:hypothetical protein
MGQFHYDKLNSFGKLSAAGDFPDAINMGDASIERMAVDLKLPEGPVSGGPLTLAVKGSAAEGGPYEAIVQSGPISAGRLAAGYGLPVPKTAFPFIKAAVSGTFAGTVEAVINAYLGV